MNTIVVTMKKNTRTQKLVLYGRRELPKNLAKEKKKGSLTLFCKLLKQNGAVEQYWICPHFSP